MVPRLFPGGPGGPGTPLSPFSPLIPATSKVSWPMEKRSARRGVTAVSSTLKGDKKKIDFLGMNCVDRMISVHEETKESNAFYAWCVENVHGVVFE